MADGLAAQGATLIPPWEFDMEDALSIQRLLQKRDRKMTPTGMRAPRRRDAGAIASPHGHKPAAPAETRRP
jgi:hypothetical protein